MSKITVEALVLLANIVFCNAGRTHYYGGSGYPILAGYNQYQGSYGNPYGYGGNGYAGYGLNGYGSGGYPGYQDYDSYDDEDYDVGAYDYGVNEGYGGYGGYGGDQYPYQYQKQLLPTKLISSPVVSEYVAPLPPISKSVTTSSLYQTHPTGSGNYGYAGNYGYGPKYGSAYGNGYYSK